MSFNSNLPNRIFTVLLTTLFFGGTGFWAENTHAQTNAQTNFKTKFKSYRVVVNSDRDLVQRDRELTLREAVALINNTLDRQDLSVAEQQQVKQLPPDRASRIEFNSSSPMTIELLNTLPPLISPGLVIDGTSHGAYDPQATTTVEIPIPVPVVTLTSAPDTDVFRGLTIAGDRITVKGLSIYGFNQPNQPTDTAPGADIVVSSRLPYGDRNLSVADHPPQDVTIVDNWLGLPPDEALQDIPSSFGVWLFDGVNTKIKRNRIYYHGGSGILTSLEASKAQIKSNMIVGNGLRGMPHAIYLEGVIADSQITDNLFCGNDGSAVYLFKTSGKTTINNNTIKFNGRRVPSAAVYLMGNDHRVTNNQISWQTGTGITIAAYPKSDRNSLANNSFGNLQGLSIDLNTRQRVNNPFWKLGDGVNPPRSSRNRRKDTANRAINAPQFLSTDFYLIDGKVNIDGVADPGSEITLYKVEPDIPRLIKAKSPLASQSLNYGPLSEVLTQAVADDEGKFGITLDNLTPGTVISAIATKPEDGTSEPALNAAIRSLQGNQAMPPAPSSAKIKPALMPQCTTKPVAKISQPPEPAAPPKRRAVSLNVPRNIHFALDKSNISPDSAEILDQVAAVLKEYPAIAIELQGHTDFRASSQYNMALSKRRAVATRNYLLKLGIDPARMTILPLGESQLRKSGNTIIDHAYNRRVEMIFRDLAGITITIEDQNSDLQPEQ